MSQEVRGYDVLPDGRIISVSPAVDGEGQEASSVSDQLGSAPDIRIVLNWTEEVKRLVPVK